MALSNNKNIKLIPEEKNRQKKFDSKNKRMSDTIIPAINKIIESDGDLQGTQRGYQTVFKYINKIISLGINNNDPEKIKDIFNHIDNLTYELNTKKLYVSYPKMSLLEYSKLGLIQKLEQIVIPKDTEIINGVDNTFGGNCHNWTLLYKQIFDALGIENSIILFEPETAHSLILLNIDGNYFIADTEGQRKFNFNKIEIGDSIDIGNFLKAHINNLNPLKVDIMQGDRELKYNFKPLSYSDEKDINKETSKEAKEKFINFIDTKKRDYFLLEYSNINKNTSEKELYSFMISLTAGKLIIIIEGVFKIKKIISLGINKIPVKNNNLSNLEIIEFLIKRTKTNIFKEPEIKLILKSIISKIPDSFINNLIIKK